MIGFLLLLPEKKFLNVNIRIVKIFKSKSSGFLTGILILLGLILNYPHLNGQSHHKNQIRWHESDRLEANDFISFGRTGLHYCVSNDKDNLYLDLVFDEAKDQKMIFRSGLLIWIDMNGKTMKKTGIRYPMGTDYQGSRRRSYQVGADNQSPQNPEAPQSNLNTIELVGFTGESERHFPADNPDNFRGSLAMGKDGKLFYRLILPLSKLAMRNSRESGGTMPFSIGIEYGFSSGSNDKEQAANSAPSYDYQSGGSRNGTNLKRKSGGTIKPGKYQGTSTGTGGINSKNPKSSAGSELHWVKNVILATSK